jgi:AcrR family transcriptional regulator
VERTGVTDSIETLDPEQSEQNENQAFGVRSPVSHKLHPTARKILAAALKILTEQGYQRMTLQAISAEAKVNKAGVWYYFGGKQQLLSALLEEIVISQSRVFGRKLPDDATLEERVDLFVGSAKQLEDRVKHFSAFYALLPEASRDVDLHEHLKTVYQAWYDWANDVLSHGARRSDTDAGHLGEFASVLLDGLFIQMVVAAPGLDLEAALANARESLMHLARRGADETA